LKPREADMQAKADLAYRNTQLLVALIGAIGRIRSVYTSQQNLRPRSASM